MEIKKLRNQFSSLISQKSKALLSFSKEQELRAITNELKTIAPTTKNTLFTLIRNSELKKKILLPKQDELCASITEYAYRSPEERPYQI